jgi:hypothetical protein
VNRDAWRALVLTVAAAAGAWWALGLSARRAPARPPAARAPVRPPAWSHFSRTAPIRLGDWKARPLPRSPLPVDDALRAQDWAGNRRLVLGGWEYQQLPGSYWTPQIEPGVGPILD